MGKLVDISLAKEGKKAGTAKGFWGGVYTRGVYSTKLKLANDCRYTIWPVLASGGETPPLSAPALALQPGESTIFSLPVSWTGKLWGRTFCTYYSSIGRPVCLTGDCGSGSPECARASALPAVTIASFDLDGDGGLDLYVVSTSRGYNVGILVVPYGGSGGDCMATGCVKDVEGGCESETSGACNSTCFAFADPKYCCSGGNAPPETCKPSPYSRYFKSRCPSAYGDVYADRGNNTRRFACASANYAITFCPRPTSLKSSVGVGAVSGPSGVKTKRVVIMALVIVTTVVAILLTVLKILSPNLAVGIALAVYTALALLFAFL
ncbi:hypothetical protein RJ640_022157 [Escallonia rubra]|uniref:Thaumatin-like protein n=1 Tax=Escallonia rubra TaxID=112253 RepID=A0AA88R4P7_9ASTE|nr:hypothetical protein RJ640_022157 [Escallonia rubra]